MTSRSAIPDDRLADPWSGRRRQVGWAAERAIPRRLDVDAPARRPPPSWRLVGPVDQPDDGIIRRRGRGPTAGRVPTVSQAVAGRALPCRASSPGQGGRRVRTPRAAPPRRRSSGTG
jgi:hypothetical protein